MSFQKISNKNATKLKKKFLMALIKSLFFMSFLESGKIRTFTSFSGPRVPYVRDLKEESIEDFVLEIVFYQGKHVVFGAFYL